MRTTPSSFVVVALGVWTACSSSSPSKVMESPPPPDTEIAVAVTSPTAGAELVASDAPAITVTGTVTTSTPGTGALEAWVNGTHVDVAADGSFTAKITPELGINHIKVEGGDGIAALVAQELDVMWAPSYLAPIDGQTGFDLPGALQLALGQRFFDGRLLGTTLDRTTDPVVARDLASAVELILWNVNLAGLLSGGIQAGSNGTAIDITVPSVTPANIVVDAKIVDSPAPAIALNVDLFGVFIGMQGSLTFSGQNLAIAGGLSADLHASAKLTLTSAEDGSITVGISDVATNVGSLSPAFTGPNGDDLNGLINVAGSSVESLVEGLLTQQLIPTFTDRVPPLLQSLLGAANNLLNNLEFTLDPGLGTPVTIKLDGHIGGLDVAAGTTSGHVTVLQDLSVTTTNPPIHTSSRGAPELAATAALVPSTSGVALSVRMDFLNGLLHALWNSGLLEGQVMLGAFQAVVSAKLPPLVRPPPASSVCQVDGERCDVELQLGQVEVQLPSFQQSFAIRASAGARVRIDGGNVSFAIQDTPTLQVWETSAKPGQLSAMAVNTLITSLVWPQLFGAIGSKLSFALPLPDLSQLGLGDLAPGLADAQLVLQMGQRPRVTGDQLSLGADLSLSTAAMTAQAP